MTLSCSAVVLAVVLAVVMLLRPHDQAVLAEAVAQSSRQECLPLHLELLNPSWSELEEMAEHLLLLTRPQEELEGLVAVLLFISFKLPVVLLVRVEAPLLQLLQVEELHGFTEQAPLGILQVEAEQVQLAQA